PSRSRAMKRNRSSMTELTFHGIHTSRHQKNGKKCNPCVRYKMSPVSQAVHTLLIAMTIVEAAASTTVIARSESSEASQMAPGMLRRGLREPPGLLRFARNDGGESLL
ncbi:MAG: hypothetical protein KGQ37_11675, partial [Hyphomicrobiales bacterium]|nr:hypothetical protein [Hyphomicrobiales bacterium]